MAEKRVVELEVKEKGVDKAVKSSSSLRTQIRQLREEMALLDQSSPEFNKLAQEAGKLQDQMQDMNRVVKNLASDTQTLDVAFEGIGAVAGSFGAVTGTMALMGSESEELQKTMVKLQAVMTVLNSLKAIENALNKDSALSTMLRTKATNQQVVAETTAGAVTKKNTILTGAQTVATNIGTVAQKAFNAVVNANPLMLLVGAITAVVGAFAYFTRSTYDAEKAQEKLNKSVERGRKEMDEFGDRIVTKAKRRLEMMEAEGATEVQLHEQRLRLIKAEDDARKARLGQEETILKQQREKYKEFIANGEHDRAKALREEINKTKEKYKTLINLEGEFNHKMDVENKSFAKKKKADEEKTEEENERKAEQRRAKKLADEEKARQKEEQAEKRRLDQLNMIQDIEDAMHEDATERQIAQLNTRFNRLIKQNQDNEELRKQLIAQQEAELKKIREESNAKEIEEQEKADQKKLELQRTLEDIQARNIQDSFARQLEEERLHYERQQEQYKDNLEILAQLKTEHDAKVKKIDQDRIDAEKKAEQDLKDFKMNSAIDTANALADILVSLSQGDEERQRRAFEIQKKVSIASALVNTYLSAQKAYASQIIPGDPTSPIRATIASGVAITTGLAQVARIKSQQFTGSGGGGAPSLPSGQTQAVNTPTPNFSVIGGAEQNDLSNEPLKAYVVSGEVSTAQELDRNRVKFATF
jgi:hypothetical protein